MSILSTKRAERMCEPPGEREKPEKAQLIPWSAPYDVRPQLSARTPATSDTLFPRHALA